ncbi:MAG: copper amine oxidase N-terminal domain-containing protein, partial [Clostridia bacterium]|nr:copper amine oxidase N-terminal domain-containing protein [Clostridia bacterium]
HSTPSRSRANKPGGGVQISAVGSDKNCQAFVLAEKVMSEYYPRWFERYPALLSDPGLYFTFEGDDAGRFTWFTDGSSGGLTDPDQIQKMSPEEVLDVLFGENS